LESGHLRYVTRSGRRFFELTVSGRRHLDRRRTLVIKRPKKWDGKWRIVSFDIAQARRFARTQLRHTLQEIGFERLQDSVWVFPYDCEELITLLKADYGLGKEVLYIIADSIENDRALRGRFKLR
jgi:DNA-binding transcriptional regulator PaaX